MRVLRLLTIFSFLLIGLQSVFSQQEEFIGIIELENKTYIDFQMSFEINDTIVQGYTITDFNGVHESKSSIIGKYNKKEDELSFREVDIIYTKSPVTELDFCYIFFKGALKNGKLTGNFSGYYEDLEKCLNGKIFAARKEKVEKRKQRLTKKVNAVVKDKSKKDSITSVLEEMQFSTRRGISADENLNVFWSGTYLKLFVWDAGTVDNDIVEIQINNEKPFLVNPRKDFYTKEFYLEGDVNTVSVKAISEGAEAPNTTKIKCSDGKGKTFDLIYDLKVDEKATLTFYKQKPSQVKE